MLVDIALWHDGNLQHESFAVAAHLITRGLIGSGNTGLCAAVATAPWTEALERK
jgi:hypothetical protein